MDGQAGFTEGGIFAIRSGFVGGDRGCRRGW